MTPVFQFEMYDIANDATRKSRRWATREAIAKIGGTILESTMIAVDETLLGREIEGMTDVGFSPGKASNFQQQVAP